MCAFQNPLHLEGYTLGEEIGRGASGTVYSAKSTETGMTYAAKRLLIEDTSIREVGVLTQLRKHPNIVEYVESKVGLDGQTQVLFVISEFCPLGNIGDYILKQQVEVVTKRNLAVQLADAITFLHKNKIVHRDIKPQNVLLTGNKAFLVLKVVDFGLATVLPSPENGANNFDRSYMRSAVGTRFYLSPEIYQSLLNDQPCRYTPSVDIFSLGLLLWAMFDGLSIPGSCQADRYLTPFAGAETDPMPIAQAVTQGDIGQLDVMSTEEAHQCKNLVRRMLSMEGRERPGAQEVLDTLIGGYGDYRVMRVSVGGARDANRQHGNRREGQWVEHDVQGASCSCKGTQWVLGCLLCYLDTNESCAKFWKGKGILFMLLAIAISLAVLLTQSFYVFMYAVVFSIAGALFLIKRIMMSVCDFELEADGVSEVLHSSYNEPHLKWWRMSPVNIHDERSDLCPCLSDQSDCFRYNFNDGPQCCSALREVVVSSSVQSLTN
ncbi:serine/threonine-protein kinase pdik1l-B-like [Branchiostoma floridae]|uniref:Serine/threonine-protein kinase pdik1l-B-like n=2 Tax=Branchiostoma floridae TaxID=7739 RepID=A0A9J7LB95_BRAFL|nr:serine/threonine-protein kinase pdik1l-B-like [Branchiostoma floridae]